MTSLNAISRITLSDYIIFSDYAMIVKIWLPLYYDTILFSYNNFTKLEAIAFVFFGLVRIFIKLFL